MNKLGRGVGDFCKAHSANKLTYTEVVQECAVQEVQENGAQPIIEQELESNIILARVIEAQDAVATVAANPTEEHKPKEAQEETLQLSANSIATIEGHHEVLANATCVEE